MERHREKSGLESFLDVGTGTGILAIAARKLGFHRVVAVDTDPLAVDATQENALLNHADGIEVSEGGIETLNATFDFIAANIISGVLVQLAPELAAHLKPGGLAVLSGILSGQAQEVIDAAARAGLGLIEKYPDGKWISLVVSRPGNG
jgi:ribosomal protein L11 methyltransferase